MLLLFVSAIAVSPTVVDASAWHYGNPSEGCMADETLIQLTTLSGSICAPECVDGLECPPEDVPAPGVAAVPECSVQEGSTYYCALKCLSDDECGQGASCVGLTSSSVGTCTYPPAGPSPAHELSNATCNGTAFGVDGGDFNFYGTCVPLWALGLALAAIIILLLGLAYCLRRRCLRRRRASRGLDASPLVDNAKGPYKGIDCLCCTCCESAESKTKREVEQIVDKIVNTDGEPKPEHIAIITEIGTARKPNGEALYCPPDCSKTNDPAWWGRKHSGQPHFESGGNCQRCPMYVATEKHGLHCCNRGHRICWKCLLQTINWDEFLADPNKLAEIRAKVNDNLSINASGWRRRSGV